MKPTQTLPALLALLLICNPLLAQDENPLMPLLAQGEGYTIHAHAAVDAQGLRIERVVVPGIAITHRTREVRSQPTQILQTGTIIRATRRASWSQSRLVGVYQNDTHMVLAVYQNLGFGDPPDTLDPNPQLGGYALIGVVKQTGDAYHYFPPRGFDDEQDQSPWTQHPTEVPQETLGLGLIEPTEEGFGLLGVRFRELEDGSFEELVEEAGEEESRQGRLDLTEPVLIAQGEGYTIHVSERSQAPIHQRDIERVIEPGIAMYRTQTETGQTHYMLATGGYAYPTRRLSWSFTRLVGLYQTDTHLVLVTFYQNGRDSFPLTPDPDAGGYTLTVFDKASGARTEIVGVDLRDRPAEHAHWPRLPLAVPQETLDLGVIEPTDTGFDVLGLSYVFTEDGTVRQLPLDQEQAPGE